MFYFWNFIMAKTQTKKKETKKSVARKVHWERTERIASVVGALSQFLPSANDDVTVYPLFSREFLLKNLLGLSDEEYELNNMLIANESEMILSTLGALKKMSPDEFVEKTKIKKEKAN